MGKDDKSIIPPGMNDPAVNTLYKNAHTEKIQEILAKSNALLIESTKGYFTFCQQHGIMPSFRRLANWYGYSYRTLYNYIDKKSEEGKYLEQIKDAIKDNLEQAALVNAVNNISAMFILKSQYDYVETTKHIIEPSESLLGQPKSVEEIADYIEADIVED